MALGDFARDPSVKPQRGGGAPEGCPRRCQSFRRRERKQCGRYALRGEVYCSTHIGPARKAKRSPLKGFYGKVAKGKLKQWMEEAANGEERASLEGEVDVARSLSAEAISLVSAVMDAKDGSITEAQKYTAMSLARESLDHVSRLVERMVKVDAIGSATMNVDQIHALLNRVLHCVGRKLREHGVEDAEDIHNELSREIGNLPIEDKANPGAATPPRININLT